MERARGTSLRPEWTNADEDEVVELQACPLLRVNPIFGATRSLTTVGWKSIHIGAFTAESLPTQRRIPDPGPSRHQLPCEEGGPHGGASVGQPFLPLESFRVSAVLSERRSGPRPEADRCW